MNTLSIRYMKKNDALVRPNDITVNLYNPYLVVNVVYIGRSNSELMVT
jgi:hypothetical protein